MMMRFQNRQELDQARVAYKKALDLETKKILICAGTGCVAGGSLKIYDRFLELMQERGIRCEAVSYTHLDVYKRQGYHPRHTGGGTARYHLLCNFGRRELAEGIGSVRCFCH